MKRGVQCIIFNDCETGVHVGGRRSSVWQRTAGAYRIATELRALGYTVQVIDYWSQLTLEGPEAVEAILTKFMGSETLFVGFSTTFYSFIYGNIFNRNQMFRQYTFDNGNNAYSTPVETMQRVKAKINELNPKTSIILAGARASHYDPIGAIKVIGYGEMHIRDFMKWKTGKDPLAVMKTSADGSIVFNNNVKAEGFDFTHSTIQWHPTDCIQPGEVLPIEISRGCIFRCKFCAFPLNGKSKIDYLKDPTVLRDELIRNYTLFGTTRYSFSDDTYNDTTDKLLYINDIVKQLPFKLEFGTYARLDLMLSHPEHAELMLENGIISAFFGIESFNYEAAKSIGKGAKTERLIELLYKLRQDVWGHKVHTSAGLIFGLPHDTYAKMHKWIDMIVDPRFPLHALMPGPLGIIPKPKEDKNSLKTFYSEFEIDPEKFGYRMLAKDTKWENMLYKTSFDGCTQLMFDVMNYHHKSTGTFQYGAHVFASMKGYGYTAEELISGRIDMMPDMHVRNNQRFLNYLSDIAKIEVA